MRKISGVLALVAVAASGWAFAAEKLESGLAVGADVPAFNVRDITGPAKGTTLCYRCKYGDRPVVTVFTREVNDTVKDLVKRIDEQVGATGRQHIAALKTFAGNWNSSDIHD